MKHLLVKGHYVSIEHNRILVEQRITKAERAYRAVVDYLSIDGGCGGGEDVRANLY